MLRKILTDCFTEIDGKTFDIVRILGSFSFFIMNIMAIIHMVKGCHDLDFVELASGLSMMLGVIAAGITFKYKSEK